MEELIESENSSALEPNMDFLAPPLGFKIAYITFDSIIGIMAVLGNGFILCVFAKEERLRRKRNFYLMSLALADFMLGLIGIPATIMVHWGQTLSFKLYSMLTFQSFLFLPNNSALCMWQICFMDTTRLLCMYSITAISIDRLKVQPIFVSNS